MGWGWGGTGGPTGLLGAGDGPSRAVREGHRQPRAVIWHFTQLLCLRK